MKKLKKVALLAIVFILGTVLNVYAAGGTAELTLTPSATEVKAGDTLTVTLAAKCETGIEGIDATLEYDKTKLELTKETAADGFTSMSGEDLVSGEYKLSVLYTNTTDAPTEANFVTLTFKVLDAVTVEETLSVKLTGIEVGDSDDEWFTVEDKEVVLTVVEEQNPGDEEQNPGDEEQKPGDEEQNPGDEEQNPGDEEQNPSNEEQNPGNEEQNPTDEETPDNTIANKPMNNAGLANFASIAIVGIIIIAIVFYAKCTKYKDVK